MSAHELELAQVANAVPVDGSEAPALLIGRLYEQHYRMIGALCRLLLRNPVDAEDAAQQTFLSAFGSLIGGTVPNLPAPWLATIARRECWARTAQRRRQPLTLDETNAPAAAAGNPLDEAIRNADLAALWRAINDLPRQQRSAFLMREFSGLSYAEVAQALGATESAIESLLVRARRDLRDGLQSAVGAVNLVATPFVLLQHRLVRLLGERKIAAGAAATTGIPVAAKLGAVVAGAIVVGAAGARVGVEAGVLVQRADVPRALVAYSTRSLATDAMVGTAALERLLGRRAVARLFPLTSSLTALQNASAGLADGTTAVTVPVGPVDTATAPAESVAPLAAGDPATGVLAPAPAAAGSPNPADTTPTDPTSTEPSPTDTAPTDSLPADTTPVDTTPVDTTPVDTTPVDTTPVDTTPVDTTPVNPTP